MKKEDISVGLVAGGFVLISVWAYSNYLYLDERWIGAIGSIIGGSMTLAGVFFTIQYQKSQYEDSLAPQLSMSLIEYSSFLYLRIKNTGKLPARKITIDLLDIHNNGNAEKSLMRDDLFYNEFELYSEETVQGRVTMYGENIQNNVFPSIDIKVKYEYGSDKKIVEFERNVTFVKMYNEKIFADVAINTREIESSLKSISRASVRTANYLDGCQIAEFDEVDILANKSLRNDLREVYGLENEPVKSRKECLKKGNRDIEMFL
mgnify:CR=1 FL=1